MRILEKGHVYELEMLDIIDPEEWAEVLRFVNREDGTKHPGTTSQEVIRALIGRTRHCDSCLRWNGNDEIIKHLQMALVLHESRALMRKVEKDEICPEDIEVDVVDGHFKIHSRLEGHG